jgi:hypothetical protein
MPKAYLSNICPTWPIDRQRTLLGTRPSEYVDDLKAATLGRLRLPNAEPNKILAQRNMLLRPSSRGDQEVCEVASFLCIAINTADFLDVVARASARGMSLLALDTGRQITAGPGAAELAREVPFFQAALRGRHAQRSREGFNRAREDEARGRAEKLRDRWHLPSDVAPLDALLMEAGSRTGVPMARVTAEKYLGRRVLAQKEYALRQRQEAGRRAARDRKKGIQDADSEA